MGVTKESSGRKLSCCGADFFSRENKHDVVQNCKMKYVINDHFERRNIVERFLKNSYFSVKKAMMY